MSNQTKIERQIVIKQKSGDVFLTILIFDDFGEDSYIVEHLPVNDLDCLKACIEQQRRERYGSYEVLDNLCNSKKGLSIDGTWYDWDDIQHLFDNYEDDLEDDLEEEKDWKKTEILFHTILYNFEDGSIIDCCNEEQIEYMIGQGLSEGELNQEGSPGYWKIKR
jgi:hypothetical protein